MKKMFGSKYFIFLNKQDYLKSNELFLSESNNRYVIVICDKH